MSSKPAAAQEENEPSMEEILASIRKIIADDSLGTKKDEPAPKKVAKAAEPAPEPEFLAAPEPVDVMVQLPVDEEDADVLDLAAVATLAPHAQDVAVSFAPEPVEVNVMMPEPVEVMVTPPPPPPAPRPVEVRAPITNVASLEDRIISDNTSNLVGQAFAALSRTSAMPAVGRSIEDVVVELLRPMLRGWVDEHLPSIVEKLVKAEIERVARGG
jgi:cell pole-organizing protein PopZ